MMIHEIFWTHGHKETEEETFFVQNSERFNVQDNTESKKSKLLKYHFMSGGAEKKKQHYINCHN